MSPDAPPRPGRWSTLPSLDRPLLSQSAASRIVGVVAVLAVLWLAVLWAVAVP